MIWSRTRKLEIHIDVRLIGTQARVGILFENQFGPTIRPERCLSSSTMRFESQVRNAHFLNPDYKFRGHVYQHPATR